MPRFAIRVLGFTAFAILTAVGCQGSKPPEKGAPPPPKVTIAQPVRHKYTPMAEYTGYLDAVRRVEVRPEVKGVLKAVHFKEGTEIDAGVLLYEIDDTDYATTLRGAEAAVERAKSDLVRAEAELTKATSDRIRADDLKKSNAISAEEYLKIVSAEQVSQAAKLQAIAGEKVAASTRDQAKKDLDKTKIYSQFAGRISRTLVTPGNLVGYGEQTQLTVMVMQHPIYVYFDIPEPDAIEYERLAKASGLPLWSEKKIPVKVAVDTEKGYPHEGVIDFREPRFDSASGTLRVRGLLNNEKRQLSSGMFARLKFPNGPETSQLILPQEAVQSDQRGRYVYIVGADNMVEARTVVTGQRIGQFFVILSGLKDEDWVIVNGVQKARPKTPVTPEKKPFAPPPPGADDTTAGATPTTVPPSTPMAK